MKEIIYKILIAILMILVIVMVWIGHGDVYYELQKLGQTIFILIGFLILSEFYSVIKSLDNE